MAKKFKIGLDIDGCMNDFHVAVNKILQRDYQIVVPPEEYDWIKYIAQVENVDYFWAKYNDEIEETMPAEIEVRFVIQKLKELGCEINILTARTYKSAAITDKWLKRHHISYDNLYFGCADKVDACKWFGIPIMVEDTPTNIEALVNGGIEVLLYEREYNKMIEHNLVIHCQSWLDIYEEISNRINKKIIIRL